MGRENGAQLASGGRIDEYGRKPSLRENDRLEEAAVQDLRELISEKLDATSANEVREVVLRYQPEKHDAEELGGTIVVLSEDASHLGVTEEKVGASLNEIERRPGQASEDDRDQR